MGGREVPLSIRRLIVEIDPRGLNVTQFCADHGVSTWFFWDLRRRFAREGDVVLERKSRAPRRVANKTAAEVEDAIVAMRKQLVDAGLDAGPETIAFHLRNLAGLPSVSTIWRILRARGFVAAEPKKAPKRAIRRFVAARANESWQVDDTTWWLADGTEVKIIDVVDDHSRLSVACVAAPACTGAAVLDVFAQAATVYGWPERFQSDNAQVFRTMLAAALAPIGVAACHSRPNHPQTNGKVERFHQTLKRWLTSQPCATTIAELQAQLDTFRRLYNETRPHRALGRRFPADVWATAPKAGPATRPLGTPTTVHRSTVDTCQAPVGRRLVTIGAAYRGKTALSVVTGTTCHVFVDGILVRALTLDLTRRTQPLYAKNGRPKIERDVPRHP